MSSKNAERFWQTKLEARLHDPGEKALVLFRDPRGHEGGTVRDLKSVLALTEADRTAVKKGDHWASAADRPQWPKDIRAQVRWTKAPLLIHPLSAERIDLRESGGLSGIDIDDIKSRSLKHSMRLIEACEGDAEKTALALWRFGPELVEEKDQGALANLWGQLPADSRVPDHNIWDHLDLTSAFAGAFAADAAGEVALFSMSIGPVQSFIASARTTSDLWAGSHLLSRLAWETMKPLVEDLGPDAVLFPRLRGIPQVDLWLRGEKELKDELFGGETWTRGGTDDNPLFAAALPNRFVALIPASQAEELAERCREHVSNWLQEKGQEVVKKLLQEAGERDNEGLYCYEQMQRQLKGFPEIHWASVPFSLIKQTQNSGALDVRELSRSMAPFFGADESELVGFLASPAWQVLSRTIQWNDGTDFFVPNPGVLYPAIYDLAERALAAAKSVRPFAQAKEEGWRCSLTGEVEWLTTDQSQLRRSVRQRDDTLWAKIAARRPAWARKGEHLGGLSALKRLWPVLFAEEAGKAVGVAGDRFSRFVVSTHTMAMTRQLAAWVRNPEPLPVDIEALRRDARLDGVALPRKLVLQGRDQKGLRDAAILPAVMDYASETDEVESASRLRQLVADLLGKSGGGIETYYGLLLMDGDRMGSILTGEAGTEMTYSQSFHNSVRDAFDHKAVTNAHLEAYGRQIRAVSPNRHMAISSSLNDFALHVVPHVVQAEFYGRLMYAGGDDVLAMLPVMDLLPAASRLREAWSGNESSAEKEEAVHERQLVLGKGFAWLKGRLMRMMGKGATASAGLVIAHHQSPLGRVLRELREAESAAKNSGRDRFHLRVLKRSGGSLQLTLPWDKMPVLDHLRLFLSDEDVSRRAVYNSLLWMKDLPAPEADGQMLAALLEHQMARQCRTRSTADEHDLAGLCDDLARLTVEEGEGSLEWLGNLLSVAEFVAREVRRGGEL